MPKWPKHPCSYPGCARLTDGRYCDEHARQVNKDYEKYSRDPETSRRYGRKWKEIRRRYITAHPYCEKCYETGHMVMAQEVHHIKRLSNGGTNEEENLMSLCKECHSRIHAERRERWNSNKKVPPLE